jgi:Uma2 family endonuclease
MSVPNVQIGPLRELAEEGAMLFPLEIVQYHRMIADGILPEGEPVELLDGYLVRKDRSAAGEDPMTVGHAHAWAISALGDLNPQLRPMGCHLRLQLPLSLPPRDEPEPDAAIVRGTRDAYRNHHPGSQDVTCVIEVADRSLRRDRNMKQRIYASAGIPCYVIINLLDFVIEVRTEPLATKGEAARYSKTRTLKIDEQVQLPATTDRSLTVAVRDLLP